MNRQRSGCGRKDELLDLLREYMEQHEDACMLVSSHISSDLEGLCDDLYMIHEGKIVMHEDTDVLLSDYALLKMDERQYADWISAICCAGARNPMAMLY